MSQSQVPCMPLWLGMPWVAQPSTLLHTRVTVAWLMPCSLGVLKWMLGISLGRRRCIAQPSAATRLWPLCCSEREPTQLREMHGHAVRCTLPLCGDMWRLWTDWHCAVWMRCRHLCRRAASGCGHKLTIRIVRLHCWRCATMVATRPCIWLHIEAAQKPSSGCCITALMQAPLMPEGCLHFRLRSSPAGRADLQTLPSLRWFTCWLRRYQASRRSSKAASAKAEPQLVAPRASPESHRALLTPAHAGRVDSVRQVLQAELLKGELRRRRPTT
mmetsp:Transcript_110724/g.196170  ORF Transcript_110724/g.196170 Transcript_110724/m.196170 type:complete len:272 (+) Transcript_110724:195-1010(+)